MSLSPPQSRSNATAPSVCKGVEQWFPDSARAFPWRSHRTPWRSLVSEIMLQQTQASRIAEIFEAFMERFPTPRAMAEAGEEAVLEAWKGLGFYRRARSLFHAACLIDREFGGEVPRSAKTLQSLPGVGRYTAGAIMSIVFGDREPIVDGNIIRLIARLDLVEGALGDRALESHAWARAEELVGAASDPAILNEGLMELGASICTPRSPSCGTCPLKHLCHAKLHERTEEIPQPRRTTPRRVVVHHAVGIERNGKWLLTQRPAAGHWAGMWELPSVESEMALSEKRVAEGLEFRVTNLQLVETFTHLLSHREIQFRIYTARTRQRKGVWHSPAVLEEIAMSSAMRRAIGRLVKRHEEAIRGCSALGRSS